MIEELKTLIDSLIYSGSPHSPKQFLKWMHRIEEVELQSKQRLIQCSFLLLGELDNMPSEIRTQVVNLLKENKDYIDENWLLDNNLIKKYYKEVDNSDD